MEQVKDALKKALIIFWDFDGVIKDSVEVKADAFEKLFVSFGKEVSSKVRSHHESHGGVSRFEKIPLYLSWAGVVATPEKTEEYCQKFSELVFKEVVESRWVPGVKEYLDTHHAKQHFVLITATPQAEIEEILTRLGINNYFRRIYGSPKSKAEAMAEVLKEENVPALETFMVGDAEHDFSAANANNVPFILRSAFYNKPLQKIFTGLTFENL
jgi:HAD superfamily hydrolase (TIGR01549 family)